MESTSCTHTMQCSAKYGTVPYLIVANPALLGAQFFNLDSLLCYEAQVVQRSVKRNISLSLLERI